MAIWPLGPLICPRLAARRLSEVEGAGAPLFLGLAPLLPRAAPFDALLLAGLLPFDGPALATPLLDAPLPETPLLATPFLETPLLDPPLLDGALLDVPAFPLPWPFPRLLWNEATAAAAAAAIVDRTPFSNIPFMLLPHPFPFPLPFPLSLPSRLGRGNDEEGEAAASVAALATSGRGAADTGA